MEGHIFAVVIIHTNTGAYSEQTSPLQNMQNVITSFISADAIVNSPIPSIIHAKENVRH